MKKAEARWPKESTMEKLEEMRYGTSGAVLRYGEQILVVGREFRASTQRFTKWSKRQKRRASQTSNAA